MASQEQVKVFKPLKSIKDIRLKDIERVYNLLSIMELDHLQLDILDRCKELNLQFNYDKLINKD